MSIEKYLRYGAIAGVFLTLLTPLVVANNMFFPYIVGKAFFFRIIVELSFGAWVILAYVNPAYRLRTSHIFWAFVGFLGVIAVANILGENPYRSFWSNYERMEGFVGLLHLLAFFVVSASVLTTEKLWTRFLQFSLATSLIVAFSAIKQFLSLASNAQVIRLDATFGNPIYLAVFVLFQIFIATFLFVQSKKIRKKGWGVEQWLYVLVAFVNVWVLYYTATRGAMLGFLCGLAIVAFVMLFEKENKVLRNISMGILAALFLGIVVFIGIKDTAFVQESPVLSRFASISPTENTGKSRILLWGIAVDGFQERPILGWGQENFIYAFGKYYNPEMYAQEPWFDRAHNVFFDWLIAGGVLGLLAYLGLFIFGALALLKIKRFSLVEKAILMGLLGAYFVQNLFVFDNTVSYIMFFSILAFLHAAEVREVVLPETQKQDVHLQNFHIISALVFIVLVGAIYAINFKPMAQNITLLKALYPYQEGVSKNLEYFKHAIAYGSMGTGEARERLAEIAEQIVSNEQIDLAVRQQFAVFTSDELQQQVEEFPFDGRQEMILGSFLTRVGNYQGALGVLEGALTRLPKKQSVYFEIGTNYLLQGKYADAQKIFKQAFDLVPQYREARILYGIASIYAEDPAVAEEVLSPLYNNGGIVPDIRFARIYEERKEFQKSIAVWNGLIEREPENIRYYVGLAGLYKNLGKKEEAIKVLEDAQGRNPVSAAEIGSYIRDIKEGN